MSFIIKGKTFTPAPDGIHHAVCVDVTPVLEEETKWGKKEKFKIVWEIAEKIPTGEMAGKPFIVSKKYTPFLGVKSNLRKDLKTWRGKDFTEEELKGFDVEAILGAPCQLVIVHEEHDGVIYSNVQAVIKAGVTRLRPSGNYVRVKDRPGYKPPAPEPKSSFDQDAIDESNSVADLAPDDIPF